LDKHIKVNDEEHNITHNEILSISADIFESFLGAIYIDQGMNKAREYANLWHKSEEGREWHKEQYKKSLEEHQNKKIKKKCECCGVEFETIDNGRNRFCSNKCKSRYRRISGIDNVTKICIGCGKEYSVNKYHAKEQQYCSRKCADKHGKRGNYDRRLVQQ